MQEEAHFEATFPDLHLQLLQQTAQANNFWRAQVERMKNNKRVETRMAMPTTTASTDGMNTFVGCCSCTALYYDFRTSQYEGLHFSVSGKHVHLICVSANEMQEPWSLCHKAPNQRNSCLTQSHSLPGMPRWLPLLSRWQPCSSLILP